MPQTFDFQRVRRDLVLKQLTDESGDEQFIVKDRLTNRYWSMGPLQYEIARIFSSPNASWEAGIAELTECFEEAPTAEQIAQTFEDFLKLGLLELSPADVAKAALPMSKYRAWLRRNGVKPGALRRSPAPVQQLYALAQRSDMSVAKLFTEHKRIERLLPDDLHVLRMGQAFYQTFAETKKERETAHLPAFVRYVRMQLPLYDPNAQFDAWYPKIKWMFSRWFFAVTLLVSLSGFLTYLTRSAEIHAMLPLVAGNLPLLVFSAATLLAIHEYTHGLTCKHFGGEVHQVGIMMLMLVIPAAYCDVSDAYLFEKRRSRAWVTFTGSYSSFVVAALGAIMWENTDPTSIFCHLGLMFMVTGFATVLANLNPLIPLDGYFLLSDLSGMENLRERAPPYARAFLTGLLTRKPKPQATLREHRVFLFYYLFSWTYQIFYMFIMIGFGWLILVRGGTVYGLILFTTVAYFLYLRTYVTRLRAAVRSWGWRRRAGFGAGVAAVCVGLFAVPVPPRVDAPALLHAGEQATLFASEEGFVAKVDAGPSTFVKKGDVVLTLAAPDLDAQLARAEASLVKASAEAVEAAAGPQREKVAMLAELQKGSAMMATRAARAAERTRRDRSFGVGTQAEEESAEKRLAQAMQKAREGELVISETKGGHGRENREKVTALVRDQERARAAHLRARREALVLRAPLDGWLIYGDKLEAGASVTLGQQLVTIAGSYELHAMVPEAYVAATRAISGVRAWVGRQSVPATMVAVGAAGVVDEAQQSQGTLVRVRLLPERDTPMPTGVRGRVRLSSADRVSLWRYLWGRHGDEIALDVWRLL